ncbi:hypothetical protein [Streptomyces sp. CMB-StM0423]|uniref:hypothetical protein n=1 Tax=Streptomyces sp. CMB-StM0423 TaxID=2059884 RepID=UPI000C6FF70A|nr:hypothetical protein [Streptomyces sp. CMB-StM0423]AUH40873.1 hypothetical protein CXR04_11935 [Streptomyces sp. CMB-StM0423]
MPKLTRPPASSAVRPRNNQTCVHHAPVCRRSCRCRTRRSEINTHLLHGLYYGLGTGLAGLLFWWVQQMI